MATLLRVKTRASAFAKAMADEAGMGVAIGVGLVGA
jgi:hypothetical protein